MANVLHFQRVTEKTKSIIIGNQHTEEHAGCTGWSTITRMLSVSVHMIKKQTLSL